MRLLVVLMLGVLAALPALARQSDLSVRSGALLDEPCANEREAACLMEAIWSATGSLPQPKQVRLFPELAGLVQRLPDPELRQAWGLRIGEVSAPVKAAPDYAFETARATIEAHGWQGFLDLAVQSAPPLNSGRPEIMGAALSLAPDPVARSQLRDLMFRLAGPPGPAAVRTGLPGPELFERAAFGHVLAEQMMRDCNGPLFDRAAALMPVSDSIRIRFWSARIRGNAGQLAGAVRRGDGRADTAFVRQAIEGYRVILELGYCPG